MAHFTNLKYHLYIPDILPQVNIHLGNSKNSRHFQDNEADIDKVVRP